MEGFWRVKDNPRERSLGHLQRWRAARTVRRSRNILCGPVAAAVVRNNYVPRSCSGLFQPVLVVQSTEHGLCGALGGPAETGVDARSLAGMDEVVQVYPVPGSYELRPWL
jgi:hypothetical protein